MQILRADRRADDIALDDLVRKRTWGELNERARRIARLFRDGFGLAPNDHVASLIGNRAEGVELVLGSMLAGLWLTPINHHLTAAEVAYIVEDSTARVLVTDAEHEATARVAIAGLAQPPTILVAGGELDRALAAVSAEALPEDGVPGATMIYTSGTTGKPKGVKRARAATVREAFDGAKAGGAPLIVMPRWDAAQALELIGARSVRHTHLVPTMFVRLLRLPAHIRAAFDASELSLVLHGAAPIARETKRAMIEWWGPVLVEYWGATESGVCTLATSAEWTSYPGTVGRATASFEVFASDDGGHRLAPGEIGTLCIRHRRFDRPFEYHRAAEKTAEAYVAGAAFGIGDLGYVDEAGFVYLSDRKAHTIISGGVNIYPAEIEAVLQGHPAVGDVAVFGVPDDEWGEQVKAAVELRAGYVASPALEAELLAFARQRLAGYKAPRSVDFEACLPRHDTGKLYTRVLRDRYWKGRHRSI